jgi:hypothetical protein
MFSHRIKNGTRLEVESVGRRISAGGQQIAEWAKPLPLPKADRPIAGACPRKDFRAVFFP